VTPAGLPEDWKKICPDLGKSSQKSCQAQNSQNIYTKAQFESSKQLHKTTLET
jgi:hypothetical protein